MAQGPVARLVRQLTPAPGSQDVDKGHPLAGHHLLHVFHDHRGLQNDQALARSQILSMARRRGQVGSYVSSAKQHVEKVSNSPTASHPSEVVQLRLHMAVLDCWKVAKKGYHGYPNNSSGPHPQFPPLLQPDDGKLPMLLNIYPYPDYPNAPLKW